MGNAERGASKSTKVSGGELGEEVLCTRRAYPPRESKLAARLSTGRRTAEADAQRLDFCLRKHVSFSEYSSAPETPSATADTLRLGRRRELFQKRFVFPEEEEEVGEESVMPVIRSVAAAALIKVEAAEEVELEEIFFLLVCTSFPVFLVVVGQSGTLRRSH